jgi:hypothetical protein
MPERKDTAGVLQSHIRHATEVCRRHETEPEIDPETTKAASTRGVVGFVVVCGPRVMS